MWKHNRSSPFSLFSFWSLLFSLMHLLFRAIAYHNVAW